MSQQTATPHPEPIGRWHGVRLALIAWLAMLGFDFFLHGGLLAEMYQNPQPFLLSPSEAFTRIPVGYLGFLISAGLLVWIVRGLDISGLWSGAKIGLILGVVIWTSLGLGLYSITTASPAILVAWAVGQTVEMAYAGAVVGYGARSGSLRRLATIVVGLTVLFLVITVIIQSVR